MWYEEPGTERSGFLVQKRGGLPMQGALQGSVFLWGGEHSKPDPGAC